jgi:hypothetical protein
VSNQGSESTYVAWRGFKRLRAGRAPCCRVEVALFCLLCWVSVMKGAPAGFARELRDVPLRPAVSLRIGGSPRRQAAGERSGEGEPVLARRSAVPPAGIMRGQIVCARKRGRCHFIGAGGGRDDFARRFGI